MARYKVRPSSVSRRLPKNARLPKEFDAFVKICRSHRIGELGWFELDYTNPEDLAPGTRSHVIPFLRLPSDDLVAFWYPPKKLSAPMIVWLSSDGEASVIASNWAEFISRMVDRQTGLPDLDDRERDDTSLKKTAKPANLTKYQVEFEKWIKSKTPTYPDVRAKEIVAQIDSIVRRHRLPCEFGSSTDLVLTRENDQIRVFWYNGGLEKFPGSSSEELHSLLIQLEERFGRAFRGTELSIFPNGSAFLDRNYQIK